MRIVLKRWKFVYIVGGYAALWVLARVTEPLPLPVYYVVGFALLVTYIAVGVRTFRGPHEPLEPPRPWWRMTARPTAGFLLASLFALSSVSFAIPRVAAQSAGYAAVYVLQFAAIAVLYLNSSIQLTRRHVAETEASSAEWRPGPLPRAPR